MFEMTKERKILLISGAIILFLGAVYRFYPDLENMFSSSSEILHKEKKLAKYRNMVQEKEKLQAKLIALNKDLVRAETGLLTGGTPALAAVDIQNTLNGIAEAAQTEIKTMRVLKAKIPEQGQYLSIPVQVTLDAGMRQLKEIIYRIENSSKLLIISKSRIRLPNTKRLNSIKADFTIEGFMKKNQDTGHQDTGQ